MVPPDLGDVAAILSCCCLGRLLQRSDQQGSSAARSCAICSAQPTGCRYGARRGVASARTPAAPNRVQRLRITAPVWPLCEELAVVTTNKTEQRCTACEARAVRRRLARRGRGHAEPAGLTRRDDKEEQAVAGFRQEGSRACRLSGPSLHAVPYAGAPPPIPARCIGA